MQELRQSPTEDSFVQDPYPFYEKARPGGDLFYWVDYDRITAVSNRSVNAFLRDRRWGREMPSPFRAEEPAHLKEFYRLEHNSMLELDPPRHTRLRGLVNRAFTSRNVAGLEPDIRQIAVSLIEELGGETPDLQKSFAERLPVLVIARLIGAPAEMAPELLRWSHAMVAMYQANRNTEAERGANSAASEFTSFVEDLIRDRRRHPRNDLISELIAARDESGKLNTEEMVSTCILLLNAGHEATAYALGNGIKAILECGIEVDHALRTENRARVVEEILRFDPPLHLFERHAKEDVEMFGHAFRKGDTVALALGAANRDPRVFEDAGTFLPDRRPGKHVALGAGIHFCLGAPLARLEISVALATLFQAFPKLSLVQTPRYADRYHFHGLTALRVSLGPRRG